MVDEAESYRQQATLEKLCPFSFDCQEVNDNSLATVLKNAHHIQLISLSLDAVVDRLGRGGARYQGDDRRDHKVHRKSDSSPLKGHRADSCVWREH